MDKVETLIQEEDGMIVRLRTATRDEDCVGLILPPGRTRCQGSRQGSHPLSLLGGRPHV